LAFTVSVKSEHKGAKQLWRKKFTGRLIIFLKMLCKAVNALEGISGGGG
jgi:hypothetical protein